MRIFTLTGQDATPSAGVALARRCHTWPALTTQAALCYSLGMYEQHRIPATLAQPTALIQVRKLVADAGDAGRTEIGRRVCTLFGFHDARGQPQLASCMQALCALEKAGRIALPPLRQNRRKSPHPLRLDCPVPPPVDLPARVDLLRDLQLVEVLDEHRRRIWNELIAREHPRGAVQHAGAQVRYLLTSEHGTLGALGFSAAALALADRDAFIGWDPATRSRNLHRVIGLSRFLIRPCVECRNLASKALALALRRLPQDCLRRYSYRPLLVETFVSQDQPGTSLAAANWQRIGQTAGKGRFAAPGARVGVKAIWLYPLARNWRALLGLPEPPSETLALGEGLASDEWARNEFGHAPLGDARLSLRLVESVVVQAAAPAQSFPAAARNNRAAVRGYYRMIDQPADSEVTPENILAPHRERTLRRMRGQQTVLCIQGGTDLYFAEHPGCVGLSLISRNEGSAGRPGIHMHSTLAVNGEGIPLGVPQIQFDAADGKSEQTKPLEECTTMRWIRGLRACSEWARQLKGVRPVSVMDREGDLGAIFAEQRSLGNVDLLLRAQHDRPMDKGQRKLVEAVRREPAQGRLEIRMARQIARRSSREQQGDQAQEGRVAEVALRWQALELPDPVRRGPTLGLSLVHVREEHAPEGAERLEWFLLTNLAVQTRQDAQRVLEWYRLRWRIEDWLRVLKSGCKVEHLGHRCRERSERAVTINAVIAWRLAAMTLMGQDTPELPPETFVSEIEIAPLENLARNRGLDTTGQSRAGATDASAQRE